MEVYPRKYISCIVPNPYWNQQKLHYLVFHTSTFTILSYPFLLKYYPKGGKKKKCKKLVSLSSNIDKYRANTVSKYVYQKVQICPVHMMSIRFYSH